MDLDASSSLPPEAQPARADGWREARSDDVNLHAEVIAPGQWHIDQLSKGRFSGRIAELALPGATIYRESLSQSTHQRGHFAGGTVLLGLPWSADLHFWTHGLCIDGGQALVSRDAEVDVCNAPASEMGMLVVDAAALEELLARTGAGRVDSWSRPTVVRLPEASALRIRALLRVAHGDDDAPGVALHDATARRLLADQVLVEAAELLSVLPPLQERSAVLRKRLVDQAREMMLAQPDEPVSMADVCKRVGASRRKLTYCFQDVLGTTPMAYLRAIRLNGVRRELLRAVDPAAGVYDVAVRWGFWHFSQFSTDYKRQFGELPSRTLQRGRERH